MITIDIIIILHEPTDVIEEMAYVNLITMAILNIIPCVLNVTVTLYFGYCGTTYQKSSILLEVKAIAYICFKDNFPNR